MSATDWSKIRYFEPYEFDSPDLRGSGERMQNELVTRLDAIRMALGQPIIITSGFRTAAHNAQVGGVDSSGHTLGYAADLVCRTSAQRFALIELALAQGIQRIGVAKSFIHLDCHPFLPKPVLWLYD